MIYFIQAGGDGPVKIGFAGSEGAAQTRLRTFQTGHPADLRLLGLLEGDREDEAILHRLFSEVRVRGEWFEPHPRLVRLATDPNGSEAMRSWVRWRRWDLLDDEGHLLPAGREYLALLEDLAREAGHVDLGTGAELARSWAATM